MAQRSAGYCVYCDRLVVRTESGTCPKGHPAEGVSGRILLTDGEETPRLPPFNVAAFALPFIWGPAHGQWTGAVFLPLWLFTDSIVRTSTRSPAGVAGAVFAVGVTLMMAAWFGKRANGLAWRRVADTRSVPQYARIQRRWALVAVPVALVLVAGAVYYDVALTTGTGM